MADDYIILSKEDRLEALSVAATASGRRVHLLERNVWVVLTLDAFYRSAEGPNIVFRGGTSLSKAYEVIKRFSEDIDVTTTSEGFCPSLPKATPPFLKTTLKRRSDGKLIDEPLPACALRPDTAQKITDDLKCIVHEKYVRPCSRSLFTLELR